MKTKSLGFIGGGRITRIFLQALTNMGLDLETVHVFDTNKEILEKLMQSFPAVRQAETPQEAAEQSIVFIALHPPIIMEMLEHVKEVITKDTIVISLAPKITIEKIASKLNSGNILRIIPNATSYVNEGYNPATFAPTFDPVKKAEVLEFIRLLGNTFEVEELKLEAYAILSAMLPTYFWFQWKELIRIGTQIGLTEEESKASVMQTLLSAHTLLFDSDLSSDQVIDLIPVKPIADHETQIREMYQTNLIGLYEKIKP